MGLDDAICYTTLLARQDAKRKQDTWFLFVECTSFKFQRFFLEEKKNRLKKKYLENWKFNFTLWYGWSESRFPFSLVCLPDLKLSEIIWFLLKNGMKARRQWSWRARKGGEKNANKLWFLTFFFEWEAIMMNNARLDGRLCYLFRVSESQINHYQNSINFH